MMQIDDPKKECKKNRTKMIYRYNQVEIRSKRVDPEHGVDLELFEAIEYLKKSKPSNLIDDEVAFRHICLLYKQIERKLNLVVNAECETLFGDILAELYRIRDTLVFEEFTMDVLKNLAPISQNNRRICLFLYILSILTILTNHSVYFCTKSSNILRNLLLFLQDPKILEKFLNDAQISFFTYIRINLHNLSKYFGFNRDIWLEFDAVRLLYKIAKLKPAIAVSIDLVVCNLLTDEQIETLVEVRDSASRLTRIVADCANSFVRKDFNRRYIQLYRFEIAESFMYLIDFLEALYKLALNDKIRKEIYFNLGFKDCYKPIVDEGNDMEKKLTLDVLCQLSFDQTIANHICSSPQNSCISYLSSQSSTLTPELNSINQTILFNLKNSENFSQIKVPDVQRAFSTVKKDATTPFEETSVGSSKEVKTANENNAKKVKVEEHVMISYNSLSRDLCLRVRQELENKGHKVWMDVTDIHGSSMESMASAVEDSYCVLICVTEKYRQSPFCQAEALYAFKMKKPIIPLIMEQGFENCRGWLGILMSDKIFINFAKKEYQKCIDNLLREIDLLRQNRVLTKQNTTTNKSSTKDDDTMNKVDNSEIKAMSNKIENWSEDEVKEWFEANKIDRSIGRVLLPCKGSLLKQLILMKKGALLVYYQYLKDEANINWKPALEFSQILDELFDPN